MRSDLAEGLDAFAETILSVGAAASMDIASADAPATAAAPVIANTAASVTTLTALPQLAPEHESEWPQGVSAHRHGTIGVFADIWLVWTSVH